MSKMFLLKCPKCGNKQRYQGQKGSLLSKVKRCVYCGHSFKAHKNVVRKVTG